MKKLMLMLMVIAALFVGTAQAAVYQAEDYAVGTYPTGLSTTDGKYSQFNGYSGIGLSHGDTFLLSQLTSDDVTADANVLHIQLTGLDNSTTYSVVVSISQQASYNGGPRQTNYVADYSYTSAADAIGASPLQFDDDDYVSDSNAIYDYDMASVTSSATGVVDIYFGDMGGTGGWMGVDQLTLVALSGSLVITESASSTDSYEAADTSSPDDSFTVKLATLPDANVVVAITSSAATGDDCWFSPSELTFTPSNWSSAQTVDVQATADFLREGAHTNTITLDPDSTDPNYGGLDDSVVTVNVTEPFGVLDKVAYQAEDYSVAGSYNTTLSTTDGEYTEYDYPETHCHGLTYLLSQLTSDDVTVDANVLHIEITGLDNSTEYSVIGTLSIQPGFRQTNLSVDYSYTSAADAIASPLQITDVDYVSADGSYMMDYYMGYVTSTADGKINIYFGDIDGAQGWTGIDQLLLALAPDGDLVIVESDSSTDSFEAPGTASPDDSFTVALSSAPDANVVVTLTSHVATGDDIWFSPSELTFTPSNWSSAQTVDIQATEDDLLERNHINTIILDVDSADPNYSQLQNISVSVNVQEISGQFGKTTTAPVIDGIYDSTWDDAKVYSNFQTSDGVDPNNADDLRIRYIAMWDDDNLYVLAEVTDDILNRDSSPADANWWFDDSIEIYTDVWDKDQEYSDGDASEIQQTVCVIELTGSPLDITPFGISPVTGGTYKMVVNDNSYVLEASIPWTSLGSAFAPVAGDAIAFGVGVNDADEAGNVRNTQRMWATDSGMLWENSINFMNVRLAQDAPTQTTCEEMLANGFDLALDFDKDCIISLSDMALFLVDWLGCTEPSDPACW